MTTNPDPSAVLPKPAGAYSASVRRGNLVFTAGQCGYFADRTLAEGLSAQIRQAMGNLRAALALVDAELSDVVTVNVFLAQEHDFAAMNVVYAEFFTDPQPARTTITAGLRPGVLFEINAQAVVD